MTRKLTFTIARFGWAIAGDLRALVYVLLGLALAGAPVGAWHLLTEHLYHDLVAQMPPALLLASLGGAAVLSGALLVRFYRCLDHLPV